MRIRKIREITYVTITGAPVDKSTYIGKSFEKVDSNFKDWLNGKGSSLLTPLAGFTYVEGKGFDLTWFEDSIATTSQDIVTNSLYQRLLIQYGELKYSFVNTETVGIPYLNKKTKEEMDLILKSEITATPGVDKLVSFKSAVVDRVYKVEFTVRTDEGENIWLMIEQ